MKLKCFFAAVFAIVANLSNAQTDQLPSNIEKGRIYTTDGQKINFTKLTTGTESYNYNNSADGKTQTIPADNVIRLEQQTGTEAGKWALWFGLSGLVGGVLGVLSTKPDTESLGVKVNGTPIILGATTGSALIGAAIGASKKKYKKVYSNPKYGSTSSPAPVRIGLACSPQGGIGVGLNYGF